MKLLSWGANSYSQLGHGIASEQCLLPTSICEDDPKLNLSDVVSVSCGGGHTLVLGKNGDLFSCGWNLKGQLGFPISKESPTLRYMECVKDTAISEVCCGWESSYAITSSNQLIVWGSNSFGQLGLDRREVFLTSTPIALPIPYTKAIAAGLRHAIVVTENGNVLVFGNGRKGQLGLVGDDGRPVPEKTRPCIISNISNAEAVACGQYHSIVSTCDGKFYAWGDNRYGQLGLDPTLHPCVFTPTEIHPFLKEQLSHRSKVVCGWTHTSVVTGNGDVYNWGRNCYGQLGCSRHERSVVWQPQKIQMEKVKQLAVGSEHNLASLESGVIASWGWNEHGSCGNGSEVNVIEPRPVKMNEKYKALLLSAGGGHSYALVEE